MRRVLSIVLILLGLGLMCLSALLFARDRGAAPAGSDPPAPQETQGETAPEALNAAQPVSVPLPESPPLFVPPTPTPEPTPEPTPVLREPQLTDYVIDPGFFEPAARQGTLRAGLRYTTRDYVNGREGAFPKCMEIYYPFGYDESGQYDVLFLLHLRQGYEDFWLSRPHYYVQPDGTMREVSTVNLLDNLIERGLCRPMLVVALCGYLDEDARWNHRSEQVYPQFTREFAEDILPFVAENCATFAAGSDRESLIAAREHFGLMGASFGAYQIELSVLGPHMELAAWYALCGGGAVTWEELYPQWSANGSLELPIDLLYFIEGEYDDIGPVEGSYLALSHWTEKFTAGGNLRFTRVGECGHEERSWVNALFNAAQLFFR